MKISIKLGISMVAFLSSPIADANGIRVGNGGFGVQCESNDSAPFSIELADLYELKKDNPSNDPLEFLDVDPISPSPILTGISLGFISSKYDPFKVAAYFTKAFRRLPEHLQSTLQKESKLPLNWGTYEFKPQGYGNITLELDNINEKVKTITEFDSITKRYFLKIVPKSNLYSDLLMPSKAIRSLNFDLGFFPDESDRANDFGLMDLGDCRLISLAVNFEHSITWKIRPMELLKNEAHLAALIFHELLSNHFVKDASPFRAKQVRRIVSAAFLSEKHDFDRKNFFADAFCKLGSCSP